MSHKFDPKKLQKLNNPDRLIDVPPALVWDKLQPQHRDVIIDIGAGTGFYSIPFLELSNGGKVYACDISDAMLEWMTENICDQYPGIVPMKMEESRVKLPDNCADVVFMINLHHELSDPAALLTECHRLLKEGGKIAIIDWKKEDMSQGPPTEIRCDVKTVMKQLETALFREVQNVDDFTKHFMVMAEK